MSKHDRQMHIQNRSMFKKTGTHIEVWNNNVDVAWRMLQKRMKNEQLKEDRQKHEHFISNTEKRRLSEALGKAKYRKKHMKQEKKQEKKKGDVK